MFERFTERARQVVVFAQEEARRFGHDHIGSEHILLGLVREEQGLGARVYCLACCACQTAAQCASWPSSARARRRSADRSSQNCPQRLANGPRRCSS